VFDDLHRLVLELVAAGLVTGIRVDHVDGLLDPRGYLERLQRELRAARGGDPDEPFWVVVEKILAPGEQLPASWPVAGTTGYEFLDACDGLFVDADGADAVVEHYAELVEQPHGFEQIVADAKLRIVRELFWGELGGLARGVAASDGAPCDEAEERRLRDALAVVTAALPVYRTYVDQHARSAEDQQRIEDALAAAAAHHGVDPLALARVGRALREDDALTMRWQQFSGPVTAKSVEDTAFYRWYAVPARNEVGAHPAHPAGAAGSFHWLCAARAERWPGSLNASSTHDTKRSEDVRARMLVLTEHPVEWSRTVEGWIDRFDAPDRTDGWMVASTLVGAWPIDAGRLAQYVTKAVREEKLRTSWTDPDAEYERRIVEFAERLRTSGEIEPVVERIAERGRRNSLAATALRLFAPGVPDVYQGSEVEFLALVDPDNRRPVDHTRLDALLEDAIEYGAAPDKLRLVSACLRARRANVELFGDGDYLPIRVDMPGVLAFARRSGDDWALLAVPLPGFQPDSTAVLARPADAPERWRHLVTLEEVRPFETPLAELLRAFPVLVLDDAHGGRSAGPSTPQQRALEGRDVLRGSTDLTPDA
jgi:(1->4)-alpha-D-glucan 1-alpha-D-glucosylmutase